jgi:pyrimidine nucleoside transport protein
VTWGVALQFIFGLIVLRWDVGRQVIQCFGDKITVFLDYSNAGSGFVYGYLVTDNNASGIALGTVFAFRVIFKINTVSFTILNCQSVTHYRFCQSSFSSASLSASCITTVSCSG